MVQFSGHRDPGEPFHIPRIHRETQDRPDRGLRFACCKTYRCPYDVAVCACLVVFNHHFGPKFRVSSDGDLNEASWPNAVKLCQKVLGYGEYFVKWDHFQRAPLAGFPLVYEPGYNRQPPGVPPDKFYSCGHKHVVKVGGAYTLRSRAVYVTANQYGPGPSSTDDAFYSTLAGGRWRATLDTLIDLFKHLPDAASFLRSMTTPIGNWLPLLVWADRLEELGGRENVIGARRIRELVPLSVGGNSRGHYV